MSKNILDNRMRMIAGLPLMEEYKINNPDVAKELLGKLKTIDAALEQIRTSMRAVDIHLGTVPALEGDLMKVAHGIDDSANKLHTVIVQLNDALGGGEEEVSTEESPEALVDDGEPDAEPAADAPADDGDGYLKGDTATRDLTQ